MTTRVTRLMLSGVLLAAFSSLPALAGGALSVVAGTRHVFHEVDWEPNEVQDDLGIMLELGKAASPVRFDLAFHVSEEEQSQDTACCGRKTVRGRMEEVSIGVIRHWRTSARVQPYVGGGVAVVGAEGWGFSDDENTSSGSALGFYGRGGVIWRLVDG